MTTTSSARARVRPSLKQVLLGVGLCLLVGVVGGLATASGLGSWYDGLQKPEWTPPSAVFSPVWTALYILMGVSLAFFWAVPPTNRQRVWTLRWFWIQLALNLAWPITFFGLRAPALGYLVICCLWLAILALMWVGSRVSGIGVWLLLPYLGWVTFASALNFAIMSFNFIRPNVQAMDADPRNQDDYFLMRRPTPAPVPTPASRQPFIGN